VIDDLDLNKTAELAFRLSNREGAYAVTLNALTFMRARRSAFLRRFIKGAGLVCADGSGILLAALLSDERIGHRVSGIDLAEAILERASSLGARVAVIGATKERAFLAQKNLSARFPGVRLFFHHGYFPENSKEEGDICNRIADFCPDFVFVCMGTPRQERFIARNAHKFGRCLSVGLGGSADVWSGRVKRAPRFMSALCLEWLWRMLCDPKKLACLPWLFEFALFVTLNHGK